MLHALLAHLRRRRSPNRRRHVPATTRRLWLETLEDRCVPATADYGPLPADPAAYDPSHILVRLDAEAGDPRDLDILDGAVFKSSFALVPGLWEVQLADGVSVESALAAYRASTQVLSAIPNYRLQIQQLPNDPQFNSLWGLHNTGQTGGTADADIDAPAAWDLTTGSDDIIVAVIDTGVDYTHPDLAANIWTNLGEIPGDGIDNDANGFIDDVHGYDFANNDGNPVDDHNHGTHVAGTIGAVGNNGIGIAGVAWNVQIMALKCFDANGGGFMADALRGFNYAVQMGAVISNNSYASTEPEATDPLFEEAIQNAAAFGHIFVAAAGNSSSDNDAVEHLPSGFDADNIISVAATDHNDQLASFSNYGATTVDLAAPGVDILSTVIGGGYQMFSGTSMATPHVTGVVALVRSHHPDWTYRQVIDQILNSVDYVPGLEGRVVTAGRINVARALNDADGPRVIGADPSGGVGGIVSSLRLFFNESIDPSSFTTADIVSFTGPGGAIAVTGLSVVPNSLDRKFDITFAPQIAHGPYEMVVGPAVADRAGNAMDQDADGVLGETPDDRFTASFLIGEQYVFSADDTPVSLIPFSVTSSQLTVAEDLSIADLDVRINISSQDVSFLGAALVAPSGVRVQLTPLTGAGAGPEYRNTVLDDEAVTPIGSGASPFSGSYVPVEPLAAFDNQSALGTWRLEVLNLFGGVINSWALLVVANPPRLSIDDVAVAEGDSGSAQATFTVRLSNAIAQPVTLDFTTADGSATAGSDYDLAAGTLTFNPGEVTKTITVAVRGDTLDETDETFFVDLTNAANATIVDAQGVGTILNDELAVSIDDVTVVEGNSGNTSAVFTVSLSEPSDHVVTVQYATSPGTAAAAVDFTMTSGAVTFAPGETSRPLTIIVKGDTRYESAENFFVNVSAVGAFVIDGQGAGTILNDDPVPVMTVADVALVEGNTGTKNLAFTVLLTVPSDDPITVAYATADGTAAAGSDYTAVSGVLTFAPGQTARNVLVALNGDAVVEPSETFVLNLSGAVNAVLMDSQAVGTILTDDVGVAIGDVAAVENDAGAFAIEFTVSLSAPTTFDVQVNYQTFNGTAGAAADYVASSGVLVFTPGESVKTIRIVGIADTRDEANETLFINLSNPINAVLADYQGQATIIDNDAPPEISIGDVALVEGNSGTKVLTFTAALSAPSGQTITVSYNTADGSATDDDYQAASGTLTFAAGWTTRSFNIVVGGDVDPEPNETFLVTLSGAVNATIADGQAIGTIQDDDSLVVDDLTLVEGDFGAATVAFAVRLLAPRDEVVTLAYATANGTAIAGTDYLAAAGTLTFAPGETLKNVPVTIIGDRLYEPDETIFLNLANASGAVIADNRGIATIANDDLIPSISVSDAWIAEGNSGTRYAGFVLSLSHAGGQPVYVSYATANGSATAGSDYQARSGVAGIGAGATSATIWVPITGDSVVEGDETLVLNLSNPTSAILADDQAIAVIADDDPLPVVFISDATTPESNSGVKALSFSVSLSAPSSQPVTVQLSTADDTASAGSDYVSKTEVVTFSPGQTVKYVSVTVNGDTLLEPTETFFVLLSAPTSAVLGDVQGVGTLQNDDSSLRVNDITVAEGNDGTTIALFTVSLTGALPADAVQVKYTLGGGTAAAGSDFIAASGTLVFAPGQTAQTIPVVVVGDTVNENNEAFYVTLSAPVNALIADGQGVATIVDAADPMPAVTIDDAFITEGASGTRTLYFTARLSAPSGKPVTVAYTTADGTASAGSDYVAKSGTLTFNPGGTTATISIVVNGDLAPEADETLHVNLTSATNAVIIDNQGSGAINDDDCLIVDDAVVTEADDGTTVARFTVRLLVPRPSLVSVDYTTANGAASAGYDYLPVAGTLAFAPGETAKTVDVVVVGDRLNEVNETFFLNLSKAAGTILTDSQGVATIQDNDAPPTLTITDAVTVVEGNSGVKTITFTLRLSEPSGQNVTVQYATADGTATAGTDYVARSGTLTFYPGQTVATITITVNADAELEGDETFALILSNPLNATLSLAEATALIVDDDSVL